MVVAQRVGIQLPRARWGKPSKNNDLAREAVGCNAGLGHPADRFYGVMYVLLPIGR